MFIGIFGNILSRRTKIPESFYLLVFGIIIGPLTGIVSFYAVNYQGKINTLLEPSLYPEKIQPMLFSLYMSDFVVLLVDQLTPYFGELIVALDLLKKDKGIIVTQTELPIKGTILENYERFDDENAAKEKILRGLPEIKYSEEFFAMVDKAFPVKSVGNVALGIIKSGKMKKHDKLFSLPDKKQIEVKTIQLNDKDSEEANGGDRFGMGYKGDNIDRCSLVPLRNDYQIEKVTLGSFHQSPFYKDDINRKLHACLNFQFVECTVSQNELKLDKELAFKKRDSVLIIDPSNQKLRVVGVFTIQ